MSDLRLCGRPKVTDGQPCGQRVGDGRQCLWHGDGVTAADRRAVAVRGGLIAAALVEKVMPESTPVPRWRSRSQIVSWLERQARRVLIGTLDPRLAGEARQHAEVALRAYELEAMEKLDGYERILAGKARRVG